ncbi:hypothetical protein BS50DRAFT_656635 [Corynespora cassiicola Philippines]|uniref:Amidase domain-containing protein n=1 Tax=Corynespora cassiicola Philippines TaxID=1448308 RepID=A0A2T2N2N1_CORCC|nr:hypothetical protein BS50DRAFT_656635 [Corynespora cassiicola Philippines]
MNSTAGLYTLPGTRAKTGAFVIDKLQDAGILILGKTNLQEVRIGRANTSAWSARGGQVSAAYVVGGFDAGGDPIGSSSGSAVAVSAQDLLPLPSVQTLKRVLLTHLIERHFMDSVRLPISPVEQALCPFRLHKIQLD